MKDNHEVVMQSPSIDLRDRAHLQRSTSAGSTDLRTYARQLVSRLQLARTELQRCGVEAVGEIDDIICNLTPFEPYEQPNANMKRESDKAARSARLSDFSMMQMTSILRRLHVPTTVRQFCKLEEFGRSLHASPKVDFWLESTDNDDESLLEVIAADIGWPYPTLRLLSDIHLFDNATVTEWSERQMTDGQPITPGHLWELISVHPRRRRYWTERVFLESMPLCKLRDALWEEYLSRSRACENAQASIVRLLGSGRLRAVQD